MDMTYSKRRSPPIVHDAQPPVAGVALGVPLSKRSNIHRRRTRRPRELLVSLVIIFASREGQRHRCVETVSRARASGLSECARRGGSLAVVVDRGGSRTHGVRLVRGGRVVSVGRGESVRRRGVTAHAVTVLQSPVGTVVIVGGRRDRGEGRLSSARCVRRMRVVPPRSRIRRSNPRRSSPTHSHQTRCATSHLLHIVRTQS